MFEESIWDVVAFLFAISSFCIVMGGAFVLFIARFGFSRFSLSCFYPSRIREALSQKRIEQSSLEDDVSKDDAMNLITCWPYLFRWIRGLFG